MEINERENNPLIRLAQSQSWQFNVVHLRTVVVKYLKSPAQTRAAITSRPWGQALSNARVSELTVEVAESARRSLLALKKCANAQELCGLPRFLPFNIIVQKAGHPFIDLAIKGQMPVEKVIRFFFALTDSLWRCGLFETTFDFFRNYGMTREGKPFFIDLGDFTTDFDHASALLRTNYWETRRDYKVLDSDSKQLFDGLAREHLVPSVLNEKWKSRDTELSL